MAHNVILFNETLLTETNATVAQLLILSRSTCDSKTVMKNEWKFTLLEVLNVIFQMLC